MKQHATAHISETRRRCRRQSFDVPGCCGAQTPWPSKPVKMIVPFAAGGGTDNLARYWAEKLGQAFGQQFVVENRGGASGTIGTEAMAKSAPDGYTLLLSSNSSTVNLPLLRKVPYDPKSLHPVVRVGDGVTGFCVHPSTGLKSMKELVDYARANPGKLSFGTPGAGTSGHAHGDAGASGRHQFSARALSRRR